MIELLKKYISNKNILILGFGREGKSTYKRICEAGGYKSVTIADKNSVPDLPENVRLITGDAYQDSLDDYDIVFKSPGVVLSKSFDLYKCKITSQTEIFIEYYSNQIIGITGTKGKSTTTTLIHHILSECSKNCVLTGNIGIPSFDVIDNIDPETKIVFELSCHQLENLSVSPGFAIFLNLFEEHLDHYGTFEKYADAKKNIYKHQSNNDILICSKDIMPSHDECFSKIISISATDSDADIFISENKILFDGQTAEIPVDNINLVGKHNYFNIAAAYAVCRLTGIDSADILNSVCTYKPLPHRLEYIGEFNGVRYYDDSISTICAATIQAISSLKNVDTVIIGGMDRGIDYTLLIDFLSECSVSNIILMSDSGKRIYDEIHEKFSSEEFLNKLHFSPKLDGAVKYAKDLTPKGKTCVMSPAAASYNDFKNFEVRGDAFKQLVFE